MLDVRHRQDPSGSSSRGDRYSLMLRLAKDIPTCSQVRGNLRCKPKTGFGNGRLRHACSHIDLPMLLSYTITCGHELVR